MRYAMVGFPFAMPSPLTTSLLRADQKAKVRSKLPPSPSKGTVLKEGVIEDDMVWFWQCQSPGQTGEMKGCGFFKILDMKGEGRGPCIGD